MSKQKLFEPDISTVNVMKLRMEKVKHVLSHLDTFCLLQVLSQYRILYANKSTVSAKKQIALLYFHKDINAKRVH